MSLSIIPPDKGQKPSSEALNEAIVMKQLDNVKMLVNNGANINELYLECPHIIWAMREGTKEISTFLLEQGADPNAMDESNTPVLNMAIYDQQLDIVKLLVAKGADVNASDKQGETPLMAAIIGGQENFVKFLIDNKADVNAVDWFNTPTLFHAVFTGQSTILQLLLNAKVNTKATNRRKNSYGVSTGKGKYRDCKFIAKLSRHTFDYLNPNHS